MEIEERPSEIDVIVASSDVGVPGSKYGETLVTFLGLKERAKRLEDKELKEWIAEKLARFKNPKHIWWIGEDKAPKEWPKTTSGKASKPELRKLLEEPMKA
jgi:mevalonyl-CoA ligase